MSEEPTVTFSLDRVVITGADSTALVIAERFASAGARVLACDAREEAVAAVNASGNGVLATVCNVAIEADVERLAHLAECEFGGVDVLINVVGVAGPTQATEDVSLEEWRSTLDINLTGMFLTARAFIPGMKARRSGSIVNFSSASTRTLLPNRSPYVASKYAVEGLTRNLARELGPHNVRANAILPGAIDNTRLRMIMQRLADEREEDADQLLKQALQYVSMRTVIQPDELASMVIFLCSDAAQHVTGQLIGVDGNVEWEE